MMNAKMMQYLCNYLWRTIHPFPELIPSRPSTSPIELSALLEAPREAGQQVCGLTSSAEGGTAGASFLPPRPCKLT